jgi:hypothetical protein
MPDIQTALSNALNNQLKNTINDWEKDDMQITQTNTRTRPKGERFFGVTNNVTRATFDYVKNNPNLTSAEICADMEKLGYKASSVSSLIAQFAVQKLAERDDRGRYIIIVPEYRPLKAKKKTLKLVPKPVEVPKRKYTKKDTTGIGALLREKLDRAPMPSQDALDAAAYAMGGVTASEPLLHTTQRKAFVSLVRNKTPDDILKDMTVFQARELYDYLKKMFGG